MLTKEEHDKLCKRAEKANKDYGEAISTINLRVCFGEQDKSDRCGLSNCSHLDGRICKLYNVVCIKVAREEASQCIHELLNADI